MTYNYRVNAKYAFEEIDLQTNDVEKAIRFMLDSAENGAVVTVTDGFTGEVLATANDGEPYITTEWSLMTLGLLMKNTWEFESEI
jgi:nitrogen fixation/metabolism regulation signal transduction histidine kinase